MILKRRYHPTNFKFFTWLLRYTYGYWLRWSYNISPINSELFSTLKPPFILVGNHTTLLDPFMTNAFVPYPVHWVASDGNMRNPIMRFLLIKLVGSIPKSKAIPDIETVSWIVDLINNRRGVVGMYPEGQSSWTGTPFPAFYSSAKLLRLLRAPVVLAKTRGGYLTKPRWSHIRRTGRTEIEFSVLFTPEQLKSLPLHEIDRQLNDALDYDDSAWCRARGIFFASNRGAESLELALYICPRCKARASLHSKGRLFTCDRCGFSVEYGDDSRLTIANQGDSAAHPNFFSGTGATGSTRRDNEVHTARGTERNSQVSSTDSLVGAPFPDSVAAWMPLQSAMLKNLLEEAIRTRSTEPIFSDEPVRLRRGKRIDSMKTIIRGKIALYTDRLEFTARHSMTAASIVFPIDTIEAEGVLKWNFFEFYQGMNVYRVVFSDPKASGKKYADTIGLLRELNKNHFPGL